MAGRDEERGRVRWAEGLCGRLGPARNAVGGVVDRPAGVLHAAVSLRDGTGLRLAGTPVEPDVSWSGTSSPTGSPPRPATPSGPVGTGWPRCSARIPPT